VDPCPTQSHSPRAGRRVRRLRKSDHAVAKLSYGGGIPLDRHPPPRHLGNCILGVGCWTFLSFLISPAASGKKQYPITNSQYPRIKWKNQARRPSLGNWILNVGCWLLAVGCWLLAVGCWLLDIPLLPDSSGLATTGQRLSSNLSGQGAGSA